MSDPLLSSLGEHGGQAMRTASYVRPAWLRASPSPSCALARTMGR
jgi:hypothetical protein